MELPLTRKVEAWNIDMSWRMGENLVLMDYTITSQAGPEEVIVQSLTAS